MVSRIEAWQRSQQQRATRDQYISLYDQITEEEHELYEIRAEQDKDGNTKLKVEVVDEGGQKTTAPSKQDQNSPQQPSKEVPPPRTLSTLKRFVKKLFRQ